MFTLPHPFPFLSAICIFCFVLVFIEAIPILPSTSLKNTAPNLCENPQIDEAVSLNEGQILVFKGSYMWLLDLEKYQLDPPLPSNSTLDACLDRTSPRGFSNEPYYLWNRHGNFKFYRNQICIDRGDRICQLTFDVSNVTNDALSRRKIPVTAIASNNMDTCEDNVHRKAITMMISKKNYHAWDGAKSILLVGQFFKAFVQISGASPYDSDRFLFKVELMKFYRQVNYESECDETATTSPSGEPSCLKGVRTFVVLPHDQLIVFFDQEYCFLSYYNLKCPRHNIRSLFGCTTPQVGHPTYVRIETIESSARRAVENPEVSNSTNTNNNNTITTTTDSAIGPDSVSVTSASFPLPSSTATTGTVAGNGSDGSVSSGVSTLSSTELTTTTRATTTTNTAPEISATLVPSTTTRSSVSLPTLPNLTTANVRPTVSIDTNGTSTPSSAATAANITTADDYLPPAHTPYGIDFLYRKRNAFMRKRSTQEAVHSGQLFVVWPSYLHVGALTFGFILVRALCLFALTVLFGLVFASLVYVVFAVLRHFQLYRTRKFNISAVFSILKNLFVSQLVYY